MIACPNSDQYVAVSFTTSPVTQTAETAVKEASLKCVTWPVLEEIGNINNRDPTSTTAINPIKII